MKIYPFIGLMALGALLAKPFGSAYISAAETYITHQAEQPNSFPARAVLDAHFNILIPQSSIDNYLTHFTDEVNTELRRQGSLKRIPQGFYASEMREIEPSFRQ